MSYLPESPAIVPDRYTVGPLATWLREALVERTDAMNLERILLRFEVLYARRRAMRRPFEPKPDLARELSWVAETFRAECHAFGLDGRDATSVRCALERKLSEWEGN